MAATELRGQLHQLLMGVMLKLMAVVVVVVVVVDRSRLVMVEQVVLVEVVN
jgi:hypothetical protein